MSFTGNQNSDISPMVISEPSESKSIEGTQAFSSPAKTSSKIHDQCCFDFVHVILPVECSLPMCCGGVSASFACSNGDCKSNVRLHTTCLKMIYSVDGRCLDCSATVLAYKRDGVDQRFVRIRCAGDGNCGWRAYVHRKPRVIYMFAFV